MALSLRSHGEVPGSASAITCVGLQRLEEQFRLSQGSPPRRLLPYLTACFPDRDTCAELVLRADAAGVNAVEIGFPYSDSIADGPVIQSSFHHALEHGFRMDHAFELASRVRSRVRCGLVGMVSYSIMHRLGCDRFVRSATSAGYDGLIIPDLPFEESHGVRAACVEAGLAFVGLIAPTTSTFRREQIARSSTGFVYQIAAAGLTGERDAVPASLHSDVADVKRHTCLPVCVGFGISTGAHVAEVCAIADGAIVGSAIIRQLAEGVAQHQPREQLIESVSSFVENLLVN